MLTHSDIPFELNRGFSLLELLIVIAIVALVAGVTSAQLKGTSESTILNTEARKTATHLRYARSKALAESRVYSVEPLSMDQGYLIQPGEELVQLPDRVSLEITTGFGQTSQNFATNSILFYPDGTSTGGFITLKGEEASRTVAVSWITSEVKVMRVNGDSDASQE